MTGPAHLNSRVFRLQRDERGSAAIEFAIVAPVMLLLIFGAFDFSHTLWTQAQLQGVVQKTARDSTLETSDVTEQAILDAKIRAQATALRNDANIDISRRYYRTFSDAAAAQAEAWTDTNGNGRCDASEPYQDENRNSTWDADGADAGQGGAKDAVVYKVTMTYPRILPMPKFLGTGATTTKLVATTVLKNQPYGDQGSYGAPVVRNCPAA